MITTVQKWGNSHGIRIPKSLMEKTNLKENDSVEILEKDGNVLVIPIKKHRTLEERIAEFQDQYNSKEEPKCEEWETGSPEGKEVL